jgi:hypothetical protein
MSDNQHSNVPEGEAEGQATHLPLTNQTVQLGPDQLGQAAAQNDSREAAAGSPGASANEVTWLLPFSPVSAAGLQAAPDLAALSVEQLQAAQHAIVSQLRAKLGTGQPTDQIVIQSSSSEGEDDTAQRPAQAVTPAEHQAVTSTQQAQQASPIKPKSKSHQHASTGGAARPSSTSEARGTTQTVTSPVTSPLKLKKDAAVGSQKNPKSRGKASKKAPPIDYAKIVRCPVCGVMNRRIKGDLHVHYFTCKSINRAVVHEVEEQRLLTLIGGTQRVIRRDSGLKAVQAQCSAVKREEQQAEEAKGTRNLGSEDSDTSDTSEYQDSYEEDSGSTDESASSSSGGSESSASISSSSSSAGSRQAKKVKPKKNKQSRISSTPAQSSSSSSEQQQSHRHGSKEAAPPPPVQSNLKSMLEEVQTQNDLRFQRLEALILQQQHQHQPTSLGLVSAHSKTSIAASAAYEHDEEFAQNIHITAMAGWPEMLQEDVGDASKFPAWKKLYSEYVSKCTDKQRTPATMAQTFHRWAQTFATVFSEQDRQLQDQGTQVASGLERARRSFTAQGVMSLTDGEFTRRYLAFCQVRIKEPSQVLQLLSTPKIDVSSGHLVELMQAVQSFSDQLKLIPKPALHQCEPSQIREAFIGSIFGAEQLRERKVDYLKCATWSEASDLMIRKASGASGVAFNPFKPLKEFSVKLSEKHDKERDRGKETKDKDTDREKGKDKADDAPDMSSKSEQTWKTKFTALATDHSIRQPRHCFASSWKTRYAYLLDCICQGGKCVRCRRKGHLPSECDDPLPEVSYPRLTSEQLQDLHALSLVEYDEEGNIVRRAKSHRFDSRSQDQPRHESRHQEDRAHSDRQRLSVERHQERPRVGGGSYQRTHDRSPSRERHFDDRHRDDRRDNRYRSEAQGQREYSTYDRDHYSRDRSQDRNRELEHRGRSPSQERGPLRSSDLCYRCDRAGHRANECTADTRADGAPIQPRRPSESPARGTGVPATAQRRP